MQNVSSIELTLAEIAGDSINYHRKLFYVSRFYVLSSCGLFCVHFFLFVQSYSSLYSFTH